MLPYYFDTDQHLTEPPNFWTGRFPKKHADLAPTFMHHPELGPGWSWDGGQTVRPMGVQSVGSEDPRKIGNFKSFEDLDPACYDPKERIAAMDIDGAQACLLYPSGVNFFHGLPDEEFYVECASVYNDAAMDWAAEGDASRIHPAAVIPINNIESGMNELKRVAEKGFKHYIINRWPSAGEMPLPEDDPWWDLVQETGIVVDLHGFGRGRPEPMAAPQLKAGGVALKGMAQLGFAQEMVAASRGAGLGISGPLVALIMTGVLERYPGLKLALIETSLGWMPYLAEQMDSIWLRHRWLSDETKLNRLPSEYLQSVHVNFDREYLGVDYRQFIGVDRILFGTDFPHIGSFYPHSRFYIQLVMRGVPEHEQEMMLWSNAASLYGVN